MEKSWIRINQDRLINLDHIETIKKVKGAKDEDSFSITFIVHSDDGGGYLIDFATEKEMDAFFNMLAVDLTKKGG
jgi:hypothetical protein